jgi:ATP-dependent DNA helicase DinG
VILHAQDRARQKRHEAVPWEGLPLRDAVFCGLWATGPDTAVDGVVRIMALRVGAGSGELERFDRLCNPFPEGHDLWPSEDCLGSEFGLDRQQLEPCPSIGEVWPEFEKFLGDGPILVPDLAEFEGWRAHVAGGASGPVGPRADVIGLVELGAILLPGSQPIRLEMIGKGRRARALEPEDVRRLAAEIVARFLGQPPEGIALAASGYLRAWRGLEAGSPGAARILRLALALVDRPGEWCGGAPCSGNAGEGFLSRCAENSATPADLIADVSPGCERDARRWEALETVPVQGGEPAPFDVEDRARLDEIFRTHLPESFAADAGGGALASYREGQHEVACAVAAALGSGELLLVHAPTGTGKTLAYLVPALLWARRHDIRIGIATYTRALQQQAMDREMPRALAALARAGVDPLPRVAVLKGRENYLCWRALKLAAPDEEDDGESWLAWTVLVLFALRDAEGDLDRLPLRPPIPLEAVGPWRRRFSELLRQVRGRSACCAHDEDKRTCAAEIARRRAERSHVVVTNQAFALARQEFFKHIVFDECEHLHDQAHGAWSHILTFRQMRGTLARLHAPERGTSSAALDRMQRSVIDGTPTARAIGRALSCWEGVAEALLRLDAALEGFEIWRGESIRERSERESHSLLREYVERPEAAGLVESRRDLCRGLNELESALAEVIERLEATPWRGIPSLRRSLDLARTELSGMLEAVEAWLPLEEGRPAFRASFFYDLEVDARGDRALAARVLLPNEVLGRNYYPQLSTGVFVSATTWLRGSFEPALGYLGLDRAAEPAPDEDRPPRVVRTFRAPEVFDYSRVLVAVPRDAPPIGRDKDAYLDYVRRFVGHLGERTRGRMLVLFTNALDARRVGEELTGFFRARSIPLWFQNMESATKEELSDLFRSRIDSVLLGVDTFWFGADFPGETLEYLVIVRLPYGVPDRYHHAQCAALGTSEQWRRIYMPRALAKFRQGFGRLMRRESDRGCVFVLDGRALEPKHRAFLRELPIGADADSAEGGAETTSARFVRGDTDRCLREALAHMGLLAELRRRGLAIEFATQEPAGP